MLRENGYDVYLVANDDYKIHKKKLINEGFNCIDIPHSRKPFSFDNFLIFLKLRRLLKENEYEIIHVHTPLVSFITRIACFNIKPKKLIYTAHGFHFYRGAPKINWLVYYTLEKLASKFTDIIVTINSEDYENAKKFFGENSKIIEIKGVGVNIHTKKKSHKYLQNLKDSLNILEEDFVISYIAELNDNKNQMFLLKNWYEIKNKIPNAKLLLIGEGKNKVKYIDYIQENNLKDINILGYRSDVEDILQISKVVTLLSLREGLPKSIMEAMSFGIPCVVSNTRGLRDLILHNSNGYVVNLEDDNSLINSFSELKSNDKLYYIFKTNTLERIKNYSYEAVMQEYQKVYGLNKF